MKKQVTVRVTGIHARDGEPTEKIITNSSGYIEDTEDGGCILEYVEEQDTGSGSIKINNKVNIAPDGKGIEIIRGGDMESKLAFGEGLVYDTEYHTPYGSMEMTVRTGSFDLVRTRQDEEMKLMAEYALEMGGQVMSSSMIIIEIKKSETV